MAGIEVTGQRRYAHQDRVCLLFALTLGVENIELYVEHDEDFRIVVKSDAPQVTLDFQVKDERPEAGAARLAEWLLHFGGNSIPLAGRLADEASSKAVFVISSRLKDEVSALAFNRMDECATKASALKREHKVALHNALEAVDVGKHLKDANLAQQRRTAGRDAIERFAGSDADKRVLVFEHMTEQRAHEALQHVLQSRYFIPARSVPGVVDTLLRDVIVPCKATRDDAGPKLWEILRNLRPSRVFPDAAKFVSWREDELLERLKAKRFLLLTGPSGCGKTWLARCIAQKLQDESYLTLETSDVAEGIEFVRNIQGDSRVCILSDPFGIHGEAAALETTRAIDLLRDYRPSFTEGLLIVTSPQAVLQSHRTTLEVGWLSVDNWDDVEMPQSTKLEVWRALAVAGGCPSHQALVVEQILQGEGPTQPLIYRALAEWCRDNPAASKIEIEDKARLTARAPLAQFLKSAPDTRIALQVLYLTSDCVSGPSREWIREHFHEVRSEILDDLETSLLVDVRNHSYVFRHPDYQRASVVSFEGLGSNAWNDTLEIIDRLVVNSPTSTRRLHGYRCVESILGVLKHQQQRVQSLLDLVMPEFEEAQQSTDSENVAAKDIWTRLARKLDSRRRISPEIEDIALRLASRFFDSISDDLRQRISKSLGRLGVFNESLTWEDGVASYKRPMGNQDWSTKGEPIDAVANGLDEEQLWNAVCSPGPLSEQLTLQAATSALGSVRAVAAFKYLSTENPVEDIALRFLQDQNPLVFARAVHGLLLAWSSLEPTRRDGFLDTARQQLNGPLHSRVMMSIVTQFKQLAGWNDDWYDGTAFPWHAAARLVSTALWNLPAAAPLKACRLANFCQEVEKAEFPERTQALAELLRALADRNTRRAGAGYRLEWELLFAQQVLFTGFVDRPEEQEALIRDYLAIPSLESLCVLVRCASVHWGGLAGHIRQVFIDFVNRKGPELDFVRASLLVIYPYGDLARSVYTIASPKEALGILPTNVLLHCLHVISGCGLGEELEAWPFDPQFCARFVKQLLKTKPSGMQLELACNALARLGDFSGAGRLRRWRKICKSASPRETFFLLRSFQWILTQSRVRVDLYWPPLQRLLAKTDLSAQEIATLARVQIAGADSIYFQDNVEVFSIGGPITQAFWALLPQDRAALEILLNQPENSSSTDTLTALKTVFESGPPHLGFVRHACLRSVGQDALELEALDRFGANTPIIQPPLSREEAPWSFWLDVLSRVPEIPTI